MKKLFAVPALLVALVCLTVTAFAANYTVKVSNSTLSLIQNGYTSHTFNLSNSAVTVNSNYNGGMTLSFRQRGYSNDTSVAFNGIQSLDFAGSYSTLTFASGLNSSYEFNLNGASVTTMYVNGSPDIWLTNGTRVSFITANNTRASISRDSTSSVVSSNITVSYDNDDWDDDDDWDDRWNNNWNYNRPTPPPSKPSNNSSNKWNDRVSKYDYSTYLKVTFDQDGDYIRDGSYKDDTIYVTGLYRNVTLSQVMKNINLVVLREYNDSRVTGKWAWKDSKNATATESGTYTYVFTPTNKDYDTIELEIEFTDYDDYLDERDSYRPSYRPGNNKPSNNWNNNWNRPNNWNNNWNKPNNSSSSSSSSSNSYGYTRSISLQMPSYINSKYELQVFCNGSRVATFSLSSSDAGKTKTYTVVTPTNGTLTASFVVK